MRESLVVAVLSMLQGVYSPWEPSQSLVLSVSAALTVNALSGTIESVLRGLVCWGCGLGGWVDGIASYC